MSYEASAVVLAYGAEPLLEECVDALLASTGLRVEVVVVDNGCTTDAVECIETRADVVVVRPGTNTGFAGGCNLGVSRSSAPVVALVNGDAVVDAGAIGELVRALDEPGVGITTGSLRLMERPDVVNSVGNPVHFLGLSWAGGLGEPAEEHQRAVDVTSATGAAVALRRELWDELGGFWEEMFAYCEDAELSLRCWQRGLAVRFVPTAVVRHRYEFSRNDTKVYLLERNRLLVLLTLFERRTLLLLLPPLLALELAVLLVAARDGWAGQKARGWWWIVRHRRTIARRRRVVQDARRVSDGELWPRLLTGSFAPGAESGLQVPGPLNAVAATYWAAVRRVLGR